MQMEAQKRHFTEKPEKRDRVSFFFKIRTLNKAFPVIQLHNTRIVTLTNITKIILAKLTVYDVHQLHNIKW